MLGSVVIALAFSCSLKNLGNYSVIIIALYLSLLQCCISNHFMHLHLFNMWQKSWTTFNFQGFLNWFKILEYNPSSSLQIAIQSAQVTWSRCLKRYLSSDWHTSYHITKMKSMPPSSYGNKICIILSGSSLHLRCSHWWVSELSNTWLSFTLPTLFFTSSFWMFAKCHLSPLLGFFSTALA